MSSSTIEAGRRHEALDGLRAVALTGVLLYHARFAWASGGFVWLTTFFTLSGFLITTLLVRRWEPGRSLELRSFWWRRCRRLLPAAWTVLALVVAMGLVGVWNDEQMRDLTVQVPSALAEVLNWTFVVQGRTYGAAFEAPSPIEHFWSLAVEEQLYLLIPLALLAMLRVGTRTRPAEGGGGHRYLDRRVLVGGFAALTAASVAWSWWWGGQNLDRAYFSTFTRAAEILVGSVLACLLLAGTRIADRRGRRLAKGAGWLGAAGILAVSAVALTTDRWMYPWGFLAVAVCSAVVITSILQGGALSQALSWSPLVWFGHRSYAVYLLHWPIFLWLTPVRVDLPQWPLFALRMSVTVLAAEVLHRLVERPGMSWRPARGRVALSRVAVPALAIVVAGVLVVGSSHLGDQVSAESTLQRFSNGEVSAPTTPPPTVNVLVIGDELAAGAAGWTVVRSDQVELHVEVAAIPGCGLAVGGWVQLSDGRVERDRDRCGDVIAQRRQLIAERRPDVVLVWGGLRDLSDRRLSYEGGWVRPGTPGGDEFLRTELGSVVEMAGEQGARVGVLNVPTIGAPLAAPAGVEPHRPPDQEQRDAMALQDAAIAKDAPPAGPPEMDPTRIARFNELLVEAAGSRQVPVLDVAAQMRAWPGGELDPARRAAGLGLAPDGANALADWLAGAVWGLLSQAAAPVAPPPSGSMSDLSIPPAPDRPPRSPAPPGRDVRVAVVGDSVAFNQLTALTGKRKGPSLVVSARTKLGCPIARGGDRRYLQDVAPFAAECDWAPGADTFLAKERPDVVLLSTGVWEVADRRFPGEERWRHVGQPEADAYVLREIVAAIDTFSANGAVVAIATSPHFEAGRTEGFTGLPESDPARVDRLNALFREAVALRSNHAVIVELADWLATQPGGELDPATRSDGVHFDDPFLPTLGSWLAPEVDRIGRA